jgi:hypothetical protein
VYSVPKSVVMQLSVSWITNKSLYTVSVFSANRGGHKLLTMRHLGEKLPNRVKLVVQFTHLTAILMFCSESTNMGPRRVRADKLKPSLEPR